jgi:hypothetical protein
MATRDPFESWKHAQRVWAEAKRRGFEVVVALDDRTSMSDAHKVGEYADKVIRWKSDGHVEDSFGLIQECSQDFVLLIADDEEPSDLLWEFAASPPFPARFGVPVIPVRGTQFWSIDCGIQERVVYRHGYKWIPRTLDDGSTTTFEGRPEGAKQVTVERNPGAVIWHFLLDAPRSEREDKAARYARVDHSSVEYHMKRLDWESHPEYFKELPPNLAAMLPKETV